MKTLQNTISAYNRSQDKQDRVICDLLKQEIDRALPTAESKIWHGSPLYYFRRSKSDRFATLACEIKKDSMGLQKHREAEGRIGKVEITGLSHPVTLLELFPTSAMAWIVSPDFRSL